MPTLPDSPADLLASLDFHSTPSPRLLLISGPSGCGKTSWCLELAAAGRERGLDFAGLLSPAVYTQGRRTAIDLLDLSSGARRRLADALPAAGSDAVHHNWRFDPQGVDWGNRVLSGCAGRPRLLIDELGPLELLHAEGLLAGLELIAGRGYRLACVVVRPSLLEPAQERWPWGQVLHFPLHPDSGTEAA